MQKSALSFYIFFGLLLLGSFNFSNAQTKISKNTTAYDANIPKQYVRLINTMIMKTGIAATNAARIHGYVGITLYQATNGGSPTYRSLTNQINSFTNPPIANKNLLWDVVANEALKTVADSLFSYLYPTLANYNYIRKALDTLHKNNNIYFKSIYKSPKQIEESAIFGRKMAEYVYQYSKSDGGFRKSIEETVARDYTHYEAPSGSSWDDTKTRSRISIQPTWGKNRTFIKDVYEQTKPANPIVFSKEPDSDFYKQAMEVYEISRQLTFDQRLIAEYWRDEAVVSYTPGGHTIHILVNALEKEKASLDKFAYAYAKTGIALNDAFICCWETKYSTNCIRPITYIQEVIDKRFKPSFYTPAFPEYTSGHSTQWGAGAEVLSSIFGNQYAFIDQTDYLRDKLVPRKFKSFDEAAQEASMSRIYGGIHFRQACEVGLEQGKRIGRSVNGLNWLK
ncbi:vanadium-dependent haloperoxidase [Arcicella sp. LKC2W]|uniref:vanadium-dependent haloperoxidase n=1 Tax=Arcicella sp. LKC2W TaxID=2984198 RepID=UPI002B1EB9E5|nr:vanadium-dependent haloperoxidase [Arcicella sp. LKC2W]MEA5459988.1 vanadium-dependent haloperoxidase [Arcicella sp. LKC2W]